MANLSCDCYGPEISSFQCDSIKELRVITKLPNSEQSYKVKVKTHNYINKTKSVNIRKTVKTVNYVQQNLVQ